MKVLWLINSATPEIAKAAGMNSSVKEGWISGLYKNIKGKVQLAICFPQMVSPEIIRGQLDGDEFFGFYKKQDKPYVYDRDVELQLKRIIEEVKPDMVHIAGTEYDHALAMVRAYNKPEKTLVTIQGLTSVYEKHYMASLPAKVQGKSTFRDLVKRDNLVSDKIHYKMRGAMEEEVIRSSGNIGGRTEWDMACTERLNPKARYFHLGEILRSSFYEDSSWKYDKCEKHSIFVSQGYYPIKGLHHMIEAMADILRFYPDAKLYVGGGVTLNTDGLKQKLKQKNYQRYLVKLIKEYNLSSNIVFLPSLSEKEMKERYLKSNVFVSPSSIENSPNSLGEAMILGVPVVASDVGGVSDMLTHKEEGFVYQSDAPYMLAHYCIRTFRECDANASALKDRLSKAKTHASISYSREKNVSDLVAAYEKICAK